MPDSETFDAWILSRQEYYHRLLIETLDAQNANFEANGDYAAAAAAARRQLKLEPWLEEAHRRCMRALALAGRRVEALHQYDLCRRALQAELGVEPAAPTQALYADIVAERIAAPEPRTQEQLGCCRRAVGAAGTVYQARRPRGRVRGS